MTVAYAIYCRVCHAHYLPDATNRAVLAAELITFSAAHDHHGVNIAVQLSSEVEPAAEDR